MLCPITSAVGKETCRSAPISWHAPATPRVAGPVDFGVDFASERPVPGSPTPVLATEDDPMVDEASLPTPLLGRKVCRAAPHSFDKIPRRQSSPRPSSLGMVGSAIAAGIDLFGAQALVGPAACQGDWAVYSTKGFVADQDCKAQSYDVMDFEAGLGIPRLVNPASDGACVGVRDATPIHGAPSSPFDVGNEQGVARATVSSQEFIAAFKKPLQPPLINSSPIHRRTRAMQATAAEFTDDELIPKRSARLAAKSRHRERRPEAQARKVMMKKLGVQVTTEHPDEASFDEFQTAFTTPLPDATREAMQVLVPRRKLRTFRSASAA